MRELLGSRGITPYALAKASKGRITEPRAYRLFREDGRFASITSDALDALCEVLEVEPGELLEQVQAGHGRTGRKAGRKG